MSNLAQVAQGTVPGIDISADSFADRLANPRAAGPSPSADVHPTLQGRLDTSLTALGIGNPLGPFGSGAPLAWGANAPPSMLPTGPIH